MVKSTKSKNLLSLIRYFIIVLSIFSINELQAQSIQDNFEGNGNISTWYGDDCLMNTSFTNPFKITGNQSNTTLHYNDIGGSFANIRFDAGRNFNLSNHTIFSFKIYVPSSSITGIQANQVSLKLQDGLIGSPWTTQTEVIKPILLNQWQTIIIDFKTDPYLNFDPTSTPPVQRSDFNRVLIQVNGEGNSDRVTAYIDDFLYLDTTTFLPSFNQLVWSDEFNGSGAIDQTKWFHQTQLPNGGSWYNGEIQHYTNRTVNSNQINGSLNLIAKKEVYFNQGHTKQYTSARLNSKFAFTYGRIEIRAKLPTGDGTWPALWMLGKNINEAGAFWQTQGFGNTSWPACGEIDIMEHWGTNQNFVQSAMHTPSSFGGTINHGGQYISTVSNQFHVYALEWTKDKMVFSVDSVVHYTYNPTIKNMSTWPFDSEQYILFNIAIQPSIAPSFLQDTLEVDYIRIYQEGSLSIENKTKNSKINFYPNPTSDELIIEDDNLINESATFYIYNISGQLVKLSELSSNNNQFKISNLNILQKGIYIIKYRSKESINSFKFIKN